MRLALHVRSFHDYLCHFGFLFFASKQDPHAQNMYMKNIKMDTFRKRVHAMDTLL